MNLSKKAWRDMAASYAEVRRRRERVLALATEGLSRTAIAKKLREPLHTVARDIHLLRRAGHDIARSRTTPVNPYSPPASECGEPDAYDGPRVDGDAEFRCTWCGHWRCDGPMEVCGGCKAWYRVNSDS